MHTWIATVPVEANAVSGATAGIGSFLVAGTVVAIAAVTAACPSGPITPDRQRSRRGNVGRGDGRHVAPMRPTVMRRRATARVMTAYP
ncbi:hypothetical protein [Streptomyces canus]|uniref:hypothetical protein n=1 Tax=Streptomyces canus TaxID=58343 RepID=UPI002E2A4DCB|nr:hypothetical protein [Streptomyces canus]